MPQPSIRVGIIGFGHIGKVHFHNLNLLENFEIISIYSRSNKRKQIPHEISFYQDYREMIKKELLDAVIIATPTFTHRDITIDCCEAGIKFILLEKPMALNVDECNEIIDKTKEYHVNLFIGHVLRYWSTYGSIYHFISENRLGLGEISSLMSKRLATFPWSQWFADEKKSGGVILDLSIHDIDYALWLLNDIEAVSCAANRIQRYQKNVWGESKTVLFFNQGKTATCEASWAKPPDFQFYTHAEIAGENEVLQFNASQIFDNQKWGIKNVFPSEDGYYNQLYYFSKLIQDEKIPEEYLVNPSDGKKVIKICQAGILSAKNDAKKIYIDEI